MTLGETIVAFPGTTGLATIIVDELIVLQTTVRELGPARQQGEMNARVLFGQTRAPGVGAVVAVRTSTDIFNTLNGRDESLTRVAAFLTCRVLLDFAAIHGELLPAGTLEQ